VIDWPTQGQDFNMLDILGASGTIRRTNPDGTYWEATGKIVMATVISAQNEELQEGNIRVQWDGGAKGSAGFPTYSNTPQPPP
jgi:hypothetical protein